MRAILCAALISPIPIAPLLHLHTIPTTYPLQIPHPKTPKLGKLPKSNKQTKETAPNSPYYH